MNNQYRFLLKIVLIVLLAWLTVMPAQAKYIGADHPKRCKECDTCNTSQSCSPGTCSLCKTQGDLSEQYSNPSLRSAFGTTIDLNLNYRSYNADDSRAQIDSGMGYGWTHTYNTYLFSQRGSLFRMDGQGQVTRYRRSGRTSYTPQTGVFETLERVGATFIIKQTDGMQYEFASIANTPFMVAGPVWRLTQITEPDGDTTTLNYNNGDLVTITDTFGRALTLGYSNHRLISITDPLNRTTLLSYDATGRKLTQITDPENSSQTYTYNLLYQLTSKVDKDGRKTSFLYSNLLPAGITDGDDDSMFTLSNPVNWATDSSVLSRQQLREYIPSTTTVTDGRGNNWQYEYDKHGYITKIIAPDAATPHFIYDPVSLLLASQTDANGNTTNFEYDQHGNLVKQTDAMLNITTFEYANPASFTPPLFDRISKHTDANGRVTTYEYDTAGNRTKETDPLAGVRSWTYNANGNVLTATDKNGHITTNEYDTFGNRTKTTDAEGNTTTMSYDAVGNLLTRTDDNNHTTTFEYDGLDRLVKQTDPAGNVRSMVYDGQGNHIKTVDRNGNQTLFVYDVRQRLVKTTDALGGVETTSYDSNDNRINMTDKNVHATSLEYDVQNRLVKTTDAEGFMTARSYDPFGNVLSQTDANGHSTTMQYDALNRLIKTTDAEGNMTQLAYDTLGGAGCVMCTGPTKGSDLVTQQTDAEGKISYLKYDGLDRQVLQIRKEGDTADIIDGSDAVTQYTYDAVGNRLTMTEPNGNTMNWDYDDINRTVKQTNAAGDIDLIAYDGVDNVTTTTAANGNVTTNTYDVLDRLIKVEDSVDLAATFTYDPVGNRLTEIDGNGNGVSNEYDAIYRLTKVTDALGEASSFTYDPVGNLLTTTDREANVTTYVYDNINRRTLTTDAIGAVTRIDYDGVGNQTKITDAEGNVTQYEFDDINRLVKETYADVGIREFTYDGVSNLLSRTDQKGQTTDYEYNDLYFLTKRDYPLSGDDTFSYDLSQRMVSACREGGADDIPLDSCAGWLVTFDYDGANRVTKTTQNNQEVEYVYDIPGRTRTMTYPGDREIVESTDPRSRLLTIDDAGAPPPIAAYSYDLGNRVIDRTYRNGVKANYSYNANNWITQLNHMNGVTQIAGFAHSYDKEGNKTFENRLHQTTRSEAYQYDDIYRLVDYKVGSLAGNTVPAPTTQTQYDLDLVGNWENKTTDAVLETRVHSATNEITQIGAIPVSHDDNGNTTDDELYTYIYDEENRLTDVTRKSDNRLVGQYQYDALSRRVTKVIDPFVVSNSVETRYYYDSARVIEEQDNLGNTQATYVYGNYIDEVLTMDRAAQVYYYHQNTIWSVTSVTDATATIVEQYAYDAYGMVTITNGANIPVPLNSWGTPHSAIDNPYMFTGRRIDEETGLYYYRARYYDSDKGRFLSRDPLGYVEGWNLYEYANGSPLNFTDPSGLDPVTLGGVALEGAKIAASVVLDVVKTTAGIDFRSDQQSKKGIRDKTSNNKPKKCVSKARTANVWTRKLSAVTGTSHKTVFKLDFEWNGCDVTGAVFNLGPGSFEGWRNTATASAKAVDTDLWAIPKPKCECCVRAACVKFSLSWQVRGWFGQEWNNSGLIWVCGNGTFGWSRMPAAGTANISPDFGWGIRVGNDIAP